MARTRSRLYAVSASLAKVGAEQTDNREIPSCCRMPRANPGQPRDLPSRFDCKIPQGVTQALPERDLVLVAGTQTTEDQQPPGCSPLPDPSFPETGRPTSNPYWTVVWSETALIVQHPRGSFSHSSC